MQTALLTFGVIAAAWFALLLWWPRAARRPDADGFAADPALTKALDDVASAHARSNGYL